MNILRLAAFSDGSVGGNPAGVVIGDELPLPREMQRVATEIGYSETVFAARRAETWRVRYFSPATEVAFCGHATIALGAALAIQQGEGVFSLSLNESDIFVEGKRQGALFSSSFQSPPTRSVRAPEDALEEVLDLFGLRPADLDGRIPPAIAHAGANHLILMLKARTTLAAMSYDFQRGKALMVGRGWVTILLGYSETAREFDVRNAFAYGGVYEDPATGAAAAALGGYLRDLRWPHSGRIALRQGDDMGTPCRLIAEIDPTPAAPIRVSGTVRPLGEGF
ncbi:MAG: PhzF family phenazine biosynthesis protein [Caldimonas sp.]